MTIAQMNSQLVPVNGKQLHYSELGQGKPLILLHGGGPGAYGVSNYRRNIEFLARTNRVIVVDMPGYGKSDPIPAPGGMFDALAEQLLGWMKAIGLDKASIVGNSLGGGTALRMALSDPARVDRLVLMGPGGGLPVLSPFPTEGLLRMLTFYDGDGPSPEKLKRVIELLVFDPSSISAELLDERYKTATLPQTLANPPLRGRGANPADDLWKLALGTLQQPTLIVWGREDRVLPLDAAFVFLKTIPNAQLHVFPKCGHWAQWEKADEFNALVADFIGRP
jgi:2-hydroxy-6-oxonona-2,4-dienedioate hydrolase/4,5:9,10-diseco-3-hydroxy-5,9,17-trioxoandrosta-1(10),2-diene-4-oate hydrolase